MSPKGPFWRSGDAEYKESKSSTPKKVTPELFLSRDGELRDIQQEFSEYVHYMLRSLVKAENVSPNVFSKLDVHMAVSVGMLHLCQRS
jgi:hypothetical protein